MLLKLIQSSAGGRDSKNSGMTAMFLLSMHWLAVAWLGDVPAQQPERTLAVWVLQANGGAIGNSHCLDDRKAEFSDLKVSINLDPQFLLSCL